MIFHIKLNQLKQNIEHYIIMILENFSSGQLKKKLRRVCEYLSTFDGIERVARLDNLFYL